MDEDRPRSVERVEQPSTPEAAQRNRSNGMITIGVLLFFLAGYAVSQNPEDTPAGAFLFGLLAVGLIVGGLVIRR